MLIMPEMVEQGLTAYKSVYDKENEKSFKNLSMYIQWKSVVNLTAHLQLFYSNIMSNLQILEVKKKKIIS